MSVLMSEHDHNMSVLSTEHEDHERARALCTCSCLMTALLHVQNEHRDLAVRPLAYHFRGIRNFQLKMPLGSNLGTRARKIVVFIGENQLNCQ